MCGCPLWCGTWSWDWGCQSALGSLSPKTAQEWVWRSSAIPRCSCQSADWWPETWDHILNWSVPAFPTSTAMAPGAPSQIFGSGESQGSLLAMTTPTSLQDISLDVGKARQVLPGFDRTDSCAGIPGTYTTGHLKFREYLPRAAGEWKQLWGACPFPL